MGVAGDLQEGHAAAGGLAELIEGDVGPGAAAAEDLVDLGDPFWGQAAQDMPQALLVLSGDPQKEAVLWRIIEGDAGGHHPELAQA